MASSQGGSATLNGQNIADILESSDFKKSLKDAETVLQYVNKRYISLNDSDYGIYAEHLTTVLRKLVQLMKEKDALFNSLFLKEHFAGSYPDGLKIGKPEEYDMNLIIKLPVDHSKLEFKTVTPSFTMIKGKEAFSEGSKLSTDLLSWVDAEGYLLQTKFQRWMESVLTKAFDGLPYCQDSTGNTRRLIVGKQDGEEREYKIRYKKSGPALTVKVITPDDRNIDVDLVPAFQFFHPIWPETVLPLPKVCNKKSWMVIAKPKKLKEGETAGINDAREWRMSFLDQEREILSGSGTVKPTIKLLKKLRDSTNFSNLSSYAIKTVVLMEMQKQKTEFWKNRGTYIFVYMLHRLTERIKTGHIPFYWDERDDLLKMKEAQYKNISNRLGKILKEIIKGIEKNPYIIAEKLLTTEELADVIENCKIPNGVHTEAKVAGNSKEDNLRPLQEKINSDNDVLAQILKTLTTLQEGQDALPQRLLEVMPQNKVFEDKATCLCMNHHEECVKKQIELENRIKILEKTMKIIMGKMSNLEADDPMVQSLRSQVESNCQNDQNY